MTGSGRRKRTCRSCSCTDRPQSAHVDTPGILAPVPNAVWRMFAHVAVRCTHAMSGSRSWLVGASVVGHQVEDRQRPAVHVVEPLGERRINLGRAGIPEVERNLPQRDEVVQMSDVDVPAHSIAGLARARSRRNHVGSRALSCTGLEIAVGERAVCKSLHGEPSPDIFPQCHGHSGGEKGLPQRWSS
jgi:hypothetical protein